MTEKKSLDAYISAAATTLRLPLEEGWLPTVRFNLEVTLKHADNVAGFALPDDAQVAPVFKA
ncbi:MAG: DUF4089 domain-containing protein [Bradyrhizobium sp.]|jgi:hypothetical protein